MTGLLSTHQFKRIYNICIIFLKVYLSLLANQFL